MQNEYFAERDVSHQEKIKLEFRCRESIWLQKRRTSTNMNLEKLYQSVNPRITNYVLPGTSVAMILSVVEYDPPLPGTNYFKSIRSFLLPG
jgi:hypothetical protein